MYILLAAISSTILPVSHIYYKESSLPDTTAFITIWIPLKVSISLHLKVFAVPIWSVPLAMISSRRCRHLKLSSPIPTYSPLVSRSLKPPSINWPSIFRLNSCNPVNFGPTAAASIEQTSIHSEVVRQLPVSLIRLLSTARQLNLWIENNCYQRSRWRKILQEWTPVTPHLWKSNWWSWKARTRVSAYTWRFTSRMFNVIWCLGI